MLNRIAIIGVGLIGASFALAAKRSHSGLTIIGIDRDETSLRQAKERSAIDAIGSIDEAASCDLILLAIPVRQTAELLTALAPRLERHSVVIDAGSTKQNVIAAARAALGNRIDQFVPCHPIAGRERHGPMAAEASLFDGKNVVVTPLPENTSSALAVAHAAWQSVGANVIEMPADSHDQVFAAVSHLPHMLAFSLVEGLAARPNAKTLFAHAASGFRDFTRIASSSPEMWRDVALDNRDQLLRELDAYADNTKRLRELVADGNADALEAFMRRAQEARERWLMGQLDQFNDNNQHHEST